MSMHDKMVANPLDMSNNKYVPSSNRPTSPLQRDTNPLGYPLKRNTLFIRQKAKDMHMKVDDLLMGKKDIAELKRENLELYSKYSKYVQWTFFNKDAYAYAFVEESTTIEKKPRHALKE